MLEKQDVANVSAAEKKDEPKFQFEFSSVLSGWLEHNQLSLGFTTYQIGKVFLIGKQTDTSRLSIYERTFGQAMGLASSADGQQLIMGSLYQIWRFVNAVSSPIENMPYDKIYIPQVGYTTGNCDVHDLGMDKDNSIIFTNTLFSCLAKVSETKSFIPVWKPPFISALAPEDRCHLNGLGFREGEARYVTAFSQTNIKEGWREVWQNAGIVMDIKTNAILCTGLSMPHSPRWYQGKLWLLNSGQGEFGYVDMETKKFKPIAFCCGYARGLNFYGDFAIIGLSKLRKGSIVQNSGLQKMLTDKGLQSHCGLLLVHLKTGHTTLLLSLGGMIEEIYDVIFIANTKTPMLLGFKGDEIQHFIDA